jgi:signal peptidase I
MGRPALAGRARSVARAVLAALWLAMIPALLAAWVVRFLVPAVVTGSNDVVRDAVNAAHAYPAVLGIGLFLLFAAAARYWRFSLPGGQHLGATRPPGAERLDASRLRVYMAAAALDKSLGSPRMRRRLERVLGVPRLAELDELLGELRVAMEARDDAAVERASAAARALAAPVLARSQALEAARLVGGLAMAAALGFGVRDRLVESYSVLSGSMLPTLQPDDRIAGNRLAYRSLGGTVSSLPRRGDVIVFRSSTVDDGNLTDVPDYLVKRVIGLPGDRISMHGGIPVINGWSVPTCDAGEYLYVLQGGDNGLDGRLAVEFLEDRAYLTVHTMGAAAFDGTYEVQPGEVFVLGDNRNNSIDSRAYREHHGGGVPLVGIEGRVQWFLAGKRPDMGWDFGRLFRPFDSLSTKVHLDGVDLQPLQAGIDQCLKKRPANTSPPAPGAPPAVGNATAGQVAP